MSTKDTVKATQMISELKINSFVNVDFHKVLLAPSPWDFNFKLQIARCERKMSLNFSTRTQRETRETAEGEKERNELKIKGLGRQEGKKGKDDRWKSLGSF